MVRLATRSREVSNRWFYGARSGRPAPPCGDVKRRVTAPPPPSRRRVAELPRDRSLAHKAALSLPALRRIRARSEAQWFTCQSPDLTDFENTSPASVLSQKLIFSRGERR